MSDSTEPSSTKGLWARLTHLFSSEPETREELLELLRSACERNLLDAEALAIIEGALALSNLTVRDVMVPRSQMDVIRVDDSIEAITRLVVETNHSRFPVVGEDKDDVLGIFLAKELLRYYAGEPFDLRDSLRPAVFVPESKRLDILLREFRVRRNHMAIVADEYGGVAGLVTIEDVLEQIVGEIDDEYDFEAEEDAIVAEQDGSFRVRADLELADFDEAFATRFDETEEADTVGGLLIHHLGRLPHIHETITLNGWRFEVVRADGRRVYWVRVHKLQAPEAESAQDA
ncbi:HlyC/CorC family transporter [Hydrogenophilus thermoluteolus]|uniref:Magnesium and cobalt efflux protein CorC n=1 Tax=Hydrogenophilus thermoluteolus TaxID=297 RepID=A0A2Z6DWW9_HYDTE|nr:magnesium/cobalt efflux protein [Hydrogenophilus thermoluteolus]